MYYRKYFSGTIPSNTEYKTTQVQYSNTTTNVNNYFNQTNFINKAIKMTLEETGIEFEYDEETCFWKINGVSFQIICASVDGYITIYRKGFNSARFQYSPFSKTNYKFYITIKGDIHGLLQIFVGSMTYPDNTSYGFIIGEGTDLRDESSIQLFLFGSINNQSNLYVLKNDESVDNYYTTINFAQKINIVNNVHQDGEITLVESVAQSGRFKLNNCYAYQSDLTGSEFYNIDGTIYYCLSTNGILVKCQPATE